ncbi:hypothetical protein [Methylobacterium sp. WL2]|uniref:hypothetical protein n=1 Tax=Methylobacterium sp. WL2 TaxID=2603902 RepID=UPI0011CA1859|nr:hypothetical protein [Methylobacterium sp. WL2]TXN54065.1 hypothetical protein FV241_25695 [Methylobacterium sp. WL2]
MLPFYQPMAPILVGVWLTAIERRSKQGIDKATLVVPIANGIRAYTIGGVGIALFDELALFSRAYRN